MQTATTAGFLPPAGRYLRFQSSKRVSSLDSAFAIMYDINILVIQEDT